MNRISSVGLVFASILSMASVPCASRTYVPHPNMPEDMRVIEGGRKLLVVWPMPGLQPSMPRNQVVAAENGEPIIMLAPGETAEAYNAKLAAQQAFIGPLAARISSRLLESRTCELLLAAVRAVAWVEPHDPEILRSFHAWDLSKALDDSNTRQMLVLVPTYFASYDYQTIKMSVRATMLVRRVPKGKTRDARLHRQFVPYLVDFDANIKLPDSTPDDREGNLRRWAADGGRLAWQAIETGSHWMADQLERNLRETERETGAWRDRNGRKGRLPDGKVGWFIEREADHFVFFNPVNDTLTYEGTVTP